MTDILFVIGRGDELSWQVSEAIMLLVREGGALGELETRMATGPDGATREIKRFPPLWLRRLERAATAGQFARRSVREIVDTILTTAPPADLLADDSEAAA